MTLQEVVLANAIQQFTDYARRHAHRKAFTDKPHPKGMEVEAERVAINAVCDEMDRLAKNPASSFSDFELLRAKMGSNYPQINIDYITLISDAFEAAGRRPAQSLRRAGNKAA